MQIHRIDIKYVSLADIMPKTVVSKFHTGFAVSSLRNNDLAASRHIQRTIIEHCSPRQLHQGCKYSWVCQFLYLWREIIPPARAISINAIRDPWSNFRVIVLLDHHVISSPFWKWCRCALVTAAVCWYKFAGHILDGHWRNRFLFPVLLLEPSGKRHW